MTKYVSCPEPGDIIIPSNGLGINEINVEHIKDLEYLVEEVKLKNPKSELPDWDMVIARQLNACGNYDPNGAALFYFAGNIETRLAPSMKETNVVGKMIKTYVRIP